ncbi:uncharacterized protein CANTADRAFT_32471, partial [Suhomyces tanzawaensis NRRL Y-17324]
SQHSSQILKRKNRLNDLLSTSQEEVKRRPRNSFEEDEGFVYKRSQENGTTKKKKQISTPIAQLNEEIGNITRDAEDDADLRLLDVPVRKKRGRPPKAKPHNFLDESSLQLSSPIKIDEPQEYVEQVSHHKLTLTDTDAIVPRQARGDGPGARRSSYYNRGKRVSSIGNGFNGEPHRDVSVSDYYKLLDTSLPEPDRMRQLLVWCLKKKLEQEDREVKQTSAEDQTVVNIAKVIKEEVLRDLMDKQISTSWYTQVAHQEPEGKEVTVPNPLNVTNTENIEVYTHKLRSMAQEKQQWQHAYDESVSTISKLTLADSHDAESELKDYLDHKQNPYPAIVDDALVTRMTSECAHIQNEVTARLEPSVDQLYHTTYQLHRTSQLVEDLETSRFLAKLAVLLRSYMTR